jgi:arylsulfatase A-like enzyme
VYSTDHGEHLGDYGNFAKSSFLDCAARIPFVVRPPKKHDFAQGAVCSSIVELSDLLPTLCEIGEATAPSDISGSSLLPLINNPEAKVRDFLHGQIDGSHLYMAGQHKYLYFVADGAELVFDIASDPEEKRNLAKDRALTASLRERLVEHLKSEDHPHLHGGSLLNRGEKPKDAQAYRAIDSAGWKPAGR